MLVEELSVFLESDCKERKNDNENSDCTTVAVTIFDNVCKTYCEKSITITLTSKAMMKALFLESIALNTLILFWKRGISP